MSEKKAIICVQNIDYLGLKIDKGEIILQPHILTKIMEFPDEILDKKQLQRFLGCLNYADIFINKLACLRQPLQKKLKKNYKWEWTPEDVRYIKRIKEICTHMKPLTIPLENDFLIIYTDASDNYWGSALVAERNNKEYLCRYKSGTFKNSEINYHSNDKELLSIKNAIKSFYIFLNKPFVVRTDSITAKSRITSTIPDISPNKRLLRWQAWFRHFNFDIQHIAGNKNYLADTLTREIIELSACRTQ